MQERGYYFCGGRERGNRSKALAAADKLHDFEPRAAGDGRGSPVVRLHDTAIQLHGHAGRVESQRFQQLPNGLALWNRAGLPVDDHPDLRVG